MLLQRFDGFQCKSMCARQKTLPENPAESRDNVQQRGIRSCLLQILTHTQLSYLYPLLLAPGRGTCPKARFCLRIGRARVIFLALSVSVTWTEGIKDVTIWERGPTAERLRRQDAEAKTSLLSICWRGGKKYERVYSPR